MELTKISRRITTTLFTAQSISSVGIIPVATVLTIVATQLTGDASMAGIPSAVILLSAAISAFLWGVLWDKIGRRKGLALGLLIAGIGLGSAAAAVQAGSFTLLLVSLVGLGFGRSAMQLGRFIAAEVNPPAHRGRAISSVVLGGTIGAILGPILVAPSSQFAVGIGLKKLAGPFVLASVLLIAIAFFVFVRLKPEPKEVGEKISELYPEKDVTRRIARPLSQIFRQPAVIVSFTAMAAAQLVMVMLMGITMLHMSQKGYPLGSISLIYMAHTLGMFAFSIMTGRLVDKWGRTPVIISGIIILLISFVLAPIEPAGILQTGLISITALLAPIGKYLTIFSALTPELIRVAIALYLLGLGWNFCFVGGSTLLTDQLSSVERSRTQGFNDVFIALASSVGSLSAGIIYAGRGYAELNSIAGTIILLPLILTILWMLTQNKKMKQAAI
ncbi:MAG: MFS transporter [Chloroflexota bacterium]